MAIIQTEKEYRAMLARIEELLPLSDDSTPADDPSLIELKYISILVEEYEDEHYPILPPSIAYALKEQMKAQNLTQEKTAKILQVSQTRISEYISGKSEPTLKVARRMCKKLNISPNVIMGV